MTPLRRLGTPAIGLLALTLTACSSGSDDGDDGPDLTPTSADASTAAPATADGIPEEWLEATAEGWPGSKGYGGSTPVLTRDPCLLLDSAPEVLGSSPETTDTGWGGYSGGEDSYRYVCGFWSPDQYSGQVQLIQTDAASAQATIDDFDSQSDTDVQDNTVETVESGGLEVHVLTRWYPTNPQGEYQAVYLDEAHDAIFTFEVNSLDEEDFDALTPQDVADLLVSILAEG